jgi:hypothetical protein
MKKFLKIFNKKSIINIFIIFIVGFVIRITVNYAYNINVFIDYTNIISIIYYYFMALFVVVINEITTQFQFPFSSFISYVFSVVKKLSFVNLDNLKLTFLRKTINKFIYGSNKMCLGSDNFVKDNCVKSNIDTPINLFHNGTSSKANKNFNIPKSYDNTSFYVRSLKGLSQGENIPQSNNKDLLQKKFTHNKGYLNNSDSGVNETKTDLFSEGSRSSFESGYTNDTNHATVSYTDINKPYLNANLNGYRKDADLRLFKPREISDVDINYRKEKIIQNVQHKASGLDYTNEIIVPKEDL